MVQTRTAPRPSISVATPTRNTLPENIRRPVCELLAARLVDAIDLHTMIKQAHWNVRGANFIALHKLFDKIAEQSEEWADVVAERARQLGAEALGTARTVAGHSSLDEYPSGIFESADHVDALSARLAAFGASTRDAIDACDRAGDKPTADIFTEITRAVDENLWFVESHRTESPSRGRT